MSAPHSVMINTIGCSRNVEDTQSRRVLSIVAGGVEWTLIVPGADLIELMSGTSQVLPGRTWLRAS
ncbi:hypothetical protein ABZ890_43700 [Streptomyces sp. NPDC046984]|uniref:hypothetical protein n=1 Tax=Streptomyces sp. NPDC046984 TaxID=3155138 RepID=UPI0033EB91D9